MKLCAVVTWVALGMMVRVEIIDTQTILMMFVMRVGLSVERRLRLCMRHSVRCRDD